MFFFSPPPPIQGPPGVSGLKGESGDAGAQVYDKNSHLIVKKKANVKKKNTYLS